MRWIEMKIRGYEAFDLDNALGICGCGFPAVTYERVYEMLCRARDRKDLIPCQIDNLSLGYRYFMAYVLDDRGFLEHEFNIDNAWITEKGLALIEFIDLIRPHDYVYTEDMYGNPFF